MKVIYKDGGILDCSIVEINDDGGMYADDMYIIEPEEILRIQDDDF